MWYPARSNIAQISLEKEMRSLVVHLLLNYCTCNQLLSLDFSDVLVSGLANWARALRGSRLMRRAARQQRIGDCPV